LCLVSSYRQNNFSLSTSQTEFVAARQAGQETLYLHASIKDFGYQQPNAAEISVAFQIISNRMRPKCGLCRYGYESGTRKFFAPKRHPPLFRARTCQTSFVKLIPLCTCKMVADVLAKSMPSPVFIDHCRVMTGQMPFALKFLLSECEYFALQFVFYDFSRSIIFGIAPSVQ